MSKEIIPGCTLCVEQCEEYPDGLKPLPTKWEICPHCLGEGKSSAYLGSFTSDEFDERFETLEEQDAYFNGCYDRTCGHCQGTGKVKVLDESRCIPEELEEYRRQEYWKRSAEAEAEAERRLGA